jgi:hypothetical protein
MDATASPPRAASLTDPDRSSHVIPAESRNPWCRECNDVVVRRPMDRGAGPGRRISYGAEGGTAPTPPTPQRPMLVYWKPAAAISSGV